MDWKTNKREWKPIDNYMLSMLQKFLFFLAFLVVLSFPLQGYAADATSHIPTESAFTAVPGLSGEAEPGKLIITEDTEWEVPANVKTIRVTLVGGGGGGGFTYKYQTQKYFPDGPYIWVEMTKKGGASGGGSYKELEVTPGEKFDINIGKGGLGVVTNGTRATAFGEYGETTSFGSIFSATGGGYGFSNAPAADYGKGIGGDINYNGNPGLTGGVGGSAPTEYGGDSAMPGSPGKLYGSGGGATLSPVFTSGNGVVFYLYGTVLDGTQNKGGDGVCVIEW